jgi:hypothetical protein
MVYSHRPFSKLPQIIAAARALYAKTMWTQSGASAAGLADPKGCWVPHDELLLGRQLVQSRGLNHVSEPYIGGVVRKIRPRP